MLPKMLYELLPYIYLTVGVGGGVSINSAIVIVASVLFLMTGVVVIFMRYQYRQSIRRLNQQYSNKTPVIY